MKRSISLLLPTLVAAAMLLGLACPALAQEGNDPPGRIARLSYMQGSVSFQPSGENNWVQANPNRPLTVGDSLWADKDSRGELHIGSTAIRMASETGISVLNLDDRTVQLQLAQGTIEVHLRRHDPEDAFEIDTPNLAFTLTRAGEYRIKADPDGNSTVIIVREGEGQVTGGGETFDLRDGQRYAFSGTDQLTYDAEEAPGFDDFEDWCQERDQRENRAESARYVSRDIDGVYDLDDYGDWRPVPEYGVVWVPRAVPVGWAPYRFGHWVWISPWGWTWVEDEPWGFAPFHYGRWAFVGGYWGWVPGPIVVRPVYAPALVAFVGGGGWSLTVGFGGGMAGVAWFPLGPRDVYIPGYRCSPRYVENVNVTNTTVINRTYVTNVYNTYNTNVDVHRNVTVNRINYTYANNVSAVTAVSKETFVNARPVAASAVHVTPEQIQKPRVVESAPIAPTRGSVLSPSSKPVNAKPTVPFAERSVVAKLPPPAAANRPPVYTNDSHPFHGGATSDTTTAMPPSGMKNAGPPARRETYTPPPPNNPPPSRTTTLEQRQVTPYNQPPPPNNPPPRREISTPPPPNNPPPSRTTTLEQHQVTPPSQPPPPPVRYTPPVKAKDEMYDVHPPLNRKPAAPPREVEQKQERRQEAPPKEEKPPRKEPGLRFH